ncbi:MAG: hypothetical protein V4497_03715 [Bacteroidota bacterium]
METTVFTIIEKIIGIPFVDDESEMGAVCFASDEDVRADFRIQFSNTDVVNYVYGIIFSLYSKENKSLHSVPSLKIPYPANADFFWENSVIGKKYRQEQPIKEVELVSLTQLNWETV